MLEQLLINNDFKTAMLLGVLVILILLAAVSLGYGLSAWFIDGDGKAIKFTLKDSKSDMLQKQAEAKIIDEDSKTYQVQYKNTIDRVPKSAVK